MLQLLVKGRWTCLLWDFVWVGCRGHIGSTQKKRRKNLGLSCLSLWVTSVQWAKLSSTNLLGPIFFLRVTHPASWENLPPIPTAPSEDREGSLLIGSPLASPLPMVFKRWSWKLHNQKNQKKSWEILVAAKHFEYNLNCLNSIWTHTGQYKHISPT